MKILTFLIVTCFAIETMAFEGDTVQRLPTSQDVRISDVQTLERISREIETISREKERVAMGLAQEQSEEKESGWIKKHPVLFGTLIGLAGGAGIGFVSTAGDDPFDDRSAGGVALVYGGIGAGIGAAIGALAAKMAE